MPVKKLGPPKGTAEAATAAAAAAATEHDRIDRLSNRYQTEQASAAPPVKAVEPAPPAAEPARDRRPRPRGVEARRREPEGMTRKTLYLSLATAAALEDAIGQIQQATGGKVSKHEALGALIAAGVAQADAVTQALRETVLQSLTGAGTTSVPTTHTHV
jgi:hypothetical protein